MSSLLKICLTLSATLGSAYVNDFNKYGRAWQVLMSADASYRKRPDDIGRMWVRSDKGEMIPVSALAFWLAKRRDRPLFEPDFVLPANRRLERPLWIGSALFGIGWGLGGYCPGPAVASLAAPSIGLVGFLLAMGAGLLLSGRAARWHAGSARAASSVCSATA